MRNGKFKVLHISNNLDRYPNCVKDSDEHPLLAKHVADEYEMFILDEHTGSSYPAQEFFYMIDGLTGFDAREHTQQLEDELAIAINYIKHLRKAAGDAKGQIEEHLVCWDAILHSPILMTNNSRILLTDQDKTFLAMTRQKS